MAESADYELELEYVSVTSFNLSDCWLEISSREEELGGDFALRIISDNFFMALASQATFCISSLSVTRCPAMSDFSD
jgi:hypothetical protein